MEFLTENIGILTGSLILFLLFVWNVLEVKRCTSNKVGTLWIVLSLTTLILFLPIIIILLGVLLLYSKLVNLILKIKYGNKFGGLLKGADAFHMMNEPSESVIQCLMLVKCFTKRSPEDFFDRMKQTLWKLHRHSKFKMIFLKRFGYSYMLKEDLKIDDCIKKLKTINCQNRTIEKKDLLMLLNNCCNTPLPKNDTVGWEMLIGTQPVKWNEDEIEYYPFFMRVHHAVTDGVTFWKLMIELADKEKVHIEPITKSFHLDDNSNMHQNYKRTQNRDALNLLLNIIRIFYVYLLFPASLLVNFVFKAKDSNILHKPLLSGEKILVWGIEKSEEYFLKIKQIKNKIPGTRFSDVIITAFSASLAKYLEKNMAEPPQYITASIPAFNDALNLQHAIPGKFVKENIRNGYSLLLMNHPVRKNKHFSEKNKSLLRRLQFIKNESSILRNCSDYYVNYFVISFVCSILPHPIGRFMLSKFRCSTIISVLPPTPKFTYCDGSMIFEDVIPWVPHLHNIGTTFLIDTHRDRLRMGFSVDKAVIDNQDAAQTIVDGVYEYLDLLAKEADIE